MGFLNKILKTVKKALASPVVQSAAIGYASRQSADFRKAAPVVETVLQQHQIARESGSKDVLKDTIYAVAQSQILQGVHMENTPVIAPVKPAFSTSSMKLTGIALVLIPLIPSLLTWLASYVGTLPPNSTPAVIGGLVIVVGQYLVTRYKATNGERQAVASVLIAQAAAPNKAPDTVAAPVVSTPVAANRRADDAVAARLPDPTPEPLTGTIDLGAGVVLSDADEIHAPSE